MGKHAFLIIAHNEFEILQELIYALDDCDNDIYVHIDKKVKNLPQLKAEISKLQILQDRIDVRWGHPSLVRCELTLLEKALQSENRYDFLHIISGLHFPLYDKESFKEFFKPFIGFSIVQPIPYSEEEIKKRLGNYHYFLKYYMSGPKIIRNVDRALWKLSLYVQKQIRMRRDYSYFHGKSSNWVCISHEAARIIVQDKNLIMRRFHRTYCADEYFVMSVLGEHNLPTAQVPNLLYQEFKQGNPRIFKEEDYSLLKESKCIYARKFTTKSLTLIEKLKNG